MNLNKMRGNGQPRKRRSGVRLILSMLVIMVVALSLASCSITVEGISLEITSIDSNGNVNATVTLSDINRTDFLSDSNNVLSKISIYYAYTEAKAAELAGYAGIAPGNTVSVLQTAYDGWYGVDVSPEENNAFKTDPTAPTSVSKQLSFQIPAEAEGKNIAFLVVLSGKDSEGGDNYNGDASSVIFNYTWKVAPTVTAPTAKTLSYTGQAQELVKAATTEDGTVYYAIGENNQTAPDFDGASANTDKKWNTDIPTGKDVGTYYVWYKVVGDENHNDTEEKPVTVTVRKADPATPTNLSATYGQTLANVSLEGWSGWAWADSTTSVGDVGENTFKANCTPTDTANYNNRTNVDVTVTVGKADPTAPTGLTATYGQTLANVTLPDGWTWADSTQSVGNVVDPAATFKANFAGDGNHNAASDVDVTVTVGKANAVAATVTANSRTYDGTEKPLVTVTGEATGGTMQYALGNESGATQPYTTSIPTATDAGTYYVWYKVVGDSSHNGTVPQPLTVTIRNPAPSGGGTTPATITIPVSGEGKDAETVNVTVQVTGATATVTSADVDKVLDAKDVGNVTVDVSSLNNSVDEVVLPAEMVKKVADAVADKGNDASGLEVKLPSGTVIFDAKTVAAIAEQSNSKDLKLHLNKVSETTLNSAQQSTVKVLNTLVVLDAYVTADGKRISDFNGGTATFSVPVKLADGQTAAGVTAYFVAENGEKTEIPCSCDGNTATGTVEHFSNYVVTYDESRVTKPEPQPEPEPEPTPGPATPTDIGYDDLSDDQKKDADAVASALGVDKDTAAAMVKAAQELSVSMDTVKLSGDALAKLDVDSSDPKGTDFGKLTARATKRTNAALTLKWAKQKKADGYLIYSNKCGKGNKMKLLKTIKKNSTVKWTQKKLKKGTYYKYMVVAYKNVNGQKMPIAASVVIHVPTKGGKTTAAKSVTVKQGKKVVSKLTVKKGKSVTVKVTENKEDKKLKIKSHRKVKFESSNKAIATVNAKGKITGKKKGKATVWAYAQNGIFKAVKVTVK